MARLKHRTWFRSPFNKGLTNFLTQNSTVPKLDVDGLLHFCCMLNFAFQKFFRENKIKGAFRKMGIWPMDSSQLISYPLSTGNNNLGEVLTV